jgi:hypothetical protein
MSLRELCDASDVPADVAEAYSVAVRRYLPRPDVLGVAIGPRVVGNEVDWESLAVLIRVREKIPIELLPKRSLIPATIAGIPTDILEGAGLPQDERSSAASPTRTDFAQTLVPGISIGVPRGGPGTLGLFVQHSVAGLSILTADHVLAPIGHGDDTRLFQPAPDDAPIEGRDPIARVFQRLPANGVGIARLDTSRPIQNEPLGVSQTIRGVRLPALGEVFEKSGRTTGVTRARVVRFGAFKNCKPGIELQPEDGSSTAEITKGGDSGAVWYDPNSFEAVAVQCRGDGDDDLLQEWAQAVILQDILAALQIMV